VARVYFALKRQQTERQEAAAAQQPFPALVTCLPSCEPQGSI
jgi:hypothetical protein